MFHLGFSKKEKMFISIGKISIGVFPILKNSLELVHTLINNNFFKLMSVGRNYLVFESVHLFIYFSIFIKFCSILIRQKIFS